MERGKSSSAQRKLQGLSGQKRANDIIVKKQEETALSFLQCVFEVWVRKVAAAITDILEESILKTENSLFTSESSHSEMLSAST